MEDFDIYADLPIITLEGNEKSEDKKSSSKKTRKLEKELHELRTKVEKLEKNNKKLATNFSSLLKTAKSEIARKDRLINELRTQLDNATFRRNQRHKKLPAPRSEDANNPHFSSFSPINTKIPPPPLHTVNLSVPPPSFSTTNSTIVTLPSMAPTNLTSTHEREQYQESNYHKKSENHFIYNNTKNKEGIRKNENNSDSDESSDGITKKSSYRSTVYGERLKKKLMIEKELENNKMREAMENLKEEKLETLKIKQKNDEQSKNLENLEIDGKKILDRKPEEKPGVRNYEKNIEKKEDGEKKKDQSKYSKNNENEDRTEEKPKLTNESRDKVGDKENLVFLNKAGPNVGTMNLEEALNTPSNSVEFSKSQITLTRKEEYLELKNDPCASRENDISKIDKHSAANYVGNDAISQNFRNNHNSRNSYHNSLLQKDYKNRDHYKYQDRNRYNGSYRSQSSNRYSRQDRYHSPPERYDRHRSSQRHRSRDRDRSNSSHRSKDDTKKKYKPQDEHNYISKKTKHENDDRNKLEFEKKYTMKVETPKRKRQSNSEEKISFESKKKRTVDEASNKIVESDKYPENKTISRLDGRINTNEKDERKVKHNNDKFEQNILFESEKKRVVDEVSNKIVESDKYSKSKTLSRLEGTINIYEKGEQKVKHNNDYSEEKISSESKKKRVVDEVSNKSVESDKYSENKTLSRLEGKMNMNKKDEKKIKHNNDNPGEKILSESKEKKVVDKVPNKVVESDKYSEQKKISRLEEKDEKKIEYNNDRTINSTECDKYDSELKEVVEEIKNSTKNSPEDLEEGEIPDSPCPKSHNKYTDEINAKNKIKIETKRKISFKRENKVDNIREANKNSINQKNEDLKLMKTVKVVCENNVPIVNNKKVENHVPSSSKASDREPINVKDSILFSALTQENVEKNIDFSKTDKNIQQNIVKKSLDMRITKKEDDGDKNNRVPVVNEKSMKQEINSNKNEKLQGAGSNKIVEERVGKNSRDKNAEYPSHVARVEHRMQNVHPTLQVKNTVSKVDKDDKDKALEKEDRKDLHHDSNDKNKQLSHSDILFKNKEDSVENKKTINTLKPKAGKNIIIIKRRRRPVQLSDSPPVLVINNTDLNKSK